MAQAGVEESSRFNVTRAQLARSFAEFEAAVGGPGDRRREELRTQLQVDFAFIAAYWLVFAATSGLLAARDFSAAVWLGVVAGECATVAALLDVAENVQTLRLLRAGSAQGGELDSLVRIMRGASLAKWLFAFSATGLLSTLFLQQGSWWHRLIGGSYALAAAVGIATVIGELASRHRPVRPVLLSNALRVSADGAVASGRAAVRCSARLTRRRGRPGQLTDRLSLRAELLQPLAEPTDFLLPP